MTGFGDDQDDMSIHPTLDDRTVEALLAGRVPRDRQDLAELGSLLAEARSIGDGPAPEPSPDLAVVLAFGVPDELLDDAVQGSGRAQGRRAASLLLAIPRRIAVKVAGLGLVAKAFLALTATAAVAAGAAAADLPESVTEAFGADSGAVPSVPAPTPPSPAGGSGDPARRQGVAGPAAGEQESASDAGPSESKPHADPADDARTNGLTRAQEQTSDTPARVPDEVGPGTNNGRPPDHAQQGPPDHAQQGPPDHAQQGPPAPALQGPPDHAQQGLPDHAQQGASEQPTTHAP